MVSFLDISLCALLISRPSYIKYIAWSSTSDLYSENTWFKPGTICQLSRDSSCFYKDPPCKIHRAFHWTCPQVWFEWIQSLHPLQFFPCSSTGLASCKSLKVLTIFYTGLMKILFTAKHGSCLEILAISLQILSFSSCKACGLLIQTLPFNDPHKQLHRLKSEDLRGHKPQINNSSPSISSMTASEKSAFCLFFEEWCQN